MVMAQMDGAAPSLASMAGQIQAKLSREGLHLRFSESAVLLLKECLAIALQRKLVPSQLICKELSSFKAVKILDSSSWDVSEKLKDVLTGSGGSASAANCKVQTIYEYKSGQLNFFDVTSGNIPDQKYSPNIANLINADELAIFDKGYFGIKTLFDIDNKNAFYLTRFVSSTNIFDLEDAQIDLSNVLKAHKEDFLELNVTLKKSEIKAHTRLICLRVPPDVAEKRRRKLNAEAKRKSRSMPSQRLLELCDWTLFITNAPKERISIEKIAHFYALRWQIELIFKQFKSIMKIHHSNTSNHSRLMCQIYGKLIAATLLFQVHANINSQLWNSSSKELSFDKFFKHFTKMAFAISQLLMKSTKAAYQFCYSQLLLSQRICKKNFQKSRPTSLQKLEGFYA